MTVMTDDGQKVFMCRICGHADCHETFSVREMMFGTREEFRYFMCASCGCLQIAGIPEDLARHYPKSYYSHQIAPAGTRQGLLSRIFERLLVETALFDGGYKLSCIAKQFTSLPETFFRARPELLKRAGIRNFRAAILDVGCGNQVQWLRDLRALGFHNLLGIDPFIESEFKVSGIPVRRIDVIQFANQYSGVFDLITFHHSLEHIPDQSGTLNAVRDLLAPSGTCVIRIPTVSSLAWDVYGVNWVELDAPRHLYIHSKDSLRRLASAAGLDLVDIQYDTTAFEFYGSEQYLLDVPLTSPQSLWVNSASNLFTRERQLEFETKARQVNVEGTAGRAAFFFRHRPGSS
jgi:SAM-dependent methyltransferase